MFMFRKLTLPTYKIAREETLPAVHRFSKAWKATEIMRKPQMSLFSLKKDRIGFSNFESCDECTAIFALLYHGINGVVHQLCSLGREKRKKNMPKRCCMRRTYIQKSWPISSERTCKLMHSHCFLSKINVLLLQCFCFVKLHMRGKSFIHDSAFST